MGERTEMEYYYCETCESALGEGDVAISTRVARPGAWGCGNPDCDQCCEDRPSPVAFCLLDGTTVAAIPDDDIDPSIFDYVMEVAR